LSAAVDVMVLPRSVMRNGWVTPELSLVRDLQRAASMAQMLQPDVPCA
jgi:hypothetical protein